MRTALAYSALLCCCVLACTGCPREAPSLRERFRGHNLLLISIDTLRADYVGAYGGQHKTTPAIDAFAAGSFLFE